MRSYQSTQMRVALHVLTLVAASLKIFKMVAIIILNPVGRQVKEISGRKTIP